MESNDGPSDAFEALSRGVKNYASVQSAFGDDDGFEAGIRCVLASVIGDVLVAAGEGSASSSQLEASVFTASSVIEWTWSSTAGSRVTIHPRRGLIAIEVDDAPVSSTEGRIAYTLVYPWGRVSLRESRLNTWPRQAFAGFVEDLDRR